MKARVNSPILYRELDPKPGDLTMGRLDPDERLGEHRTSEPYNVLG